MSEKNEVPSADSAKAKEIAGKYPYSLGRTDYRALVDDIFQALSALRASWEKEKASLLEVIKTENRKVNHYIDKSNLLEAEKKGLEAEAKYLREHTHCSYCDFEAPVDIDASLISKHIQQDCKNHPYAILRDQIDTLTCALAEAREKVINLTQNQTITFEGGLYHIVSPEEIEEILASEPSQRASEEMKGLRKVVEAAKDKDRRGYDYYTKIDEALEAYESRGKV